MGSEFQATVERTCDGAVHCMDLFPAVELEKCVNKYFRLNDDGHSRRSKCQKPTNSKSAFVKIVEMKHIYNDGGRAAAGYSGKCGDCVARAVAIATEQPYEQVYQALANVNASTRGRSKSSGRRTARSGVIVKGVAFKRYMAALGWTWTATMGIGTGCTVHLADGELPMGRLIVSVSKHYCAVIDGVIHDTHDPSERGTTIYPPGTEPEQMPKNVRWLENGNGWAYEPKRCVYGYWRKAGNADISRPASK